MYPVSKTSIKKKSNKEVGFNVENVCTVTGASYPLCFL